MRMHIAHVVSLSTLLGAEWVVVLDRRLGNTLTQHFQRIIRLRGGEGHLCLKAFYCSFSAPWPNFYIFPRVDVISRNGKH